MDITPELHESAPLISRYGGGAFVIAGERREGSVLVSAKQAHTLALQKTDSLSMKDLSPLFEEENAPEIILFGTGSTTQILNADIRKALEEKSVAYDVMDTGAACRTLNILLAEERRVAALLIAI